MKDDSDLQAGFCRRNCYVNGLSNLDPTNCVSFVARDQGAGYNLMSGMVFQCDLITPPLVPNALTEHREYSSRIENHEQQSRPN
jgi:hypothetical protein